MLADGAHGSVIIWHFCAKVLMGKEGREKMSDAFTPLSSCLSHSLFSVSLFLSMIVFTHVVHHWLVGYFNIHRHFIRHVCFWHMPESHSLTSPQPSNTDAFYCRLAVMCKWLWRTIDGWLALSVMYLLKYCFITKASVLFTIPDLLISTFSYWIHNYLFY